MSGIFEVLTKAMAFVCIIATGYGLKKAGFFAAKDFYLISKIVIRITLPCAIIANFSNLAMDNALLFMCVLGFFANVVMVALGYLSELGSTPANRAFSMINLSGYNIGNFTLPFVQSFLGPVGFAATSLFDAGNAVMCTGVTYTAASIAAGKGEKVNLLSVVKSLLSSMPFDAYVIMTILAILRLQLPAVVTSFATTVGAANPFLALLMIGIGFEVHMDNEKIGKIIKIMVMRYGTALLFSLAAFYFLPFPLEIRQTMAIVAFGPVSSVSPAYTGRLDGDVELSSAINSLSIIISIITITIALVVIL